MASTYDGYSSYHCLGELRHSQTKELFKAMEQTEYEQKKMQN